MLTRLLTFAHALTTARAYQEEDGQALVEYGLLVALIAAVCVVVIGLLGTQISAAFQSIVTAL